MKKDSHDKLAVSEIRYRRLFETAQDGILILNEKTGKIIDANPFLLNIIGYSLKELIGKELWNIGMFKNIKEAKALFKELQNKGYIRYENMPLENKNKKTVEVEFICNSYQVGDLSIIQCNVRDISERVIIAKSLAAHTESIERLNKVMVGREIKMIELKKEIAALKKINDGFKKEIGLK
ncbi:MAG: PAS domain S-box protein [Patescibacteria group bacterium]